MKGVVAFLGMPLVIFGGPKHLDMDLEFATSIVPSGLITVKVAQEAKDVLVDPVLLLMYNVNSFVTVDSGAQVPQGVEGIVAFTNSKSLEVHELALGKVCAVAVVKPKRLTITNISTLLKVRNSPLLPDFNVLS